MFKALSMAGEDLGEDNSREEATFVGRNAVTSTTIAAKKLRYRTESVLIVKANRGSPIQLQLDLMRRCINRIVFDWKSVDSERCVSSAVLVVLM